MAIPLVLLAIMSVFLSESGQVVTSSSPSDSTSRVYNRLEISNIDGTQSEGAGPSSRGLTTATPSKLHHPQPRSFHWQGTINDHDCFPSQAEDSAHVDYQDQSTEKIQDMVVSYCDSNRGQGGTLLVARPPPVMERTEFSAIIPTSGDIHARLQFGLGHCGGPQLLEWPMDSEEQILPINQKELLVIWKALMLQQWTGNNIRVMCDNTTTIAYVNKFGGTRSQALLHLSRRIWNFCLQTDTRLHLQYVASAFNPEDAPSRRMEAQLEWRIATKYFVHLDRMWGPHTVDMFAHRTNHHLPLFETWKSDPTALATDAMSMDWRRMG